MSGYRDYRHQTVTMRLHVDENSPVAEIPPVYKYQSVSYLPGHDTKSWPRAIPSPVGVQVSSNVQNGLLDKSLDSQDIYGHIHHLPLRAANEQLSRSFDSSQFPLHPGPYFAQELPEFGQPIFSAKGADRYFSVVGRGTGELRYPSNRLDTSLDAMNGASNSSERMYSSQEYCVSGSHDRRYSSTLWLNRSTDGGEGDVKRSMKMITQEHGWRRNNSDMGDGSRTTDRDQKTGTGEWHAGHTNGSWNANGLTSDSFPDVEEDTTRDKSISNERRQNNGIGPHETPRISSEGNYESNDSAQHSSPQVQISSVRNVREYDIIKTQRSIPWSSSVDQIKVSNHFSGENFMPPYTGVSKPGLIADHSVIGIAASRKIRKDSVDTEEFQQCSVPLNDSTFPNFRTKLPVHGSGEIVNTAFKMKGYESRGQLMRELFSQKYDSRKRNSEGHDPDVPNVTAADVAKLTEDCNKLLTDQAKSSKEMEKRFLSRIYDLQKERSCLLDRIEELTKQNLDLVERAKSAEDRLDRQEREIEDERNQLREKVAAMVNTNLSEPNSITKSTTKFKNVAENDDWSILPANQQQTTPRFLDSDDGNDVTLKRGRQMAQEELAACQIRFAIERERWLHEKVKVLHYQKLLENKYEAAIAQNRLLRARVAEGHLLQISNTAAKTM